MINIDKYVNACSQPQSDYAVANFVDGAQYTTERKFKQCVIELDTAYESLEDAEYNIAMEKIKLDNLKTRLVRSVDGSSQHRKYQLKIDRAYKRIARMERRLAGKKKEVAAHEANLEKYSAALGITEDTPEQDIEQMLSDAEASYYVIKLAMDTAAHIISQKGGPSSGVSLALQNMPKEDIERFNKIVPELLSAVGDSRYIAELHNESSGNTAIEQISGKPQLLKKVSGG